MKTCPVCKAIAFDDALVCYGCLHRFEEDEAARVMPDDLGARMDAWLGASGGPGPEDAPPAPIDVGGNPTGALRGAPAKADGEGSGAPSAACGGGRDEEGGWTMRIEFRCPPADAGSPGAVRAVPFGSDGAVPRFAFTEDGFVVSVGAARPARSARSSDATPARRRSGLPTRSVLRRRPPKDGKPDRAEPAEQAAGR